MTASYQTSAFLSISNPPTYNSRKNRKTGAGNNLWQCEVEGFDGELEYFEVEAATPGQAAAKAESLFGASAYNINVYQC